MRDKIITAGVAALLGGAGVYVLAPRLDMGAQGPVQLERTTVRVSVVGEVNRPGVYSLSSGARVQDALRSAGGFAPKAETSLVNVAQIVEDGDQVLVPSKTVPGSAEKPSAGPTPTKRINVNNATQAELEALPGVGPSFAKRIIGGRPYASLKDLDKVKGVGPKMLKKLEAWVRF